MTEEEMLAHYDDTKHVRVRQLWPGYYVCDECAEIVRGNEQTVDPSRC